MQKRLLEEKRLLNEKGELNDRGYATQLLLKYHRKDIKAPFFKIKEWDYYLVMNEKFAVALTVADNSYMGLLSVSFIDFEKTWFKTSSVIKLLTFGRFHLPESSEKGNVEYKDSRIRIAFLNDGTKRRLQCEMKKFNGDSDFRCDIVLSGEPKDSMVIVTPFHESKKAFYYNQKINGMAAEGRVWYGGSEYNFDQADSFGLLDWGRGVWPYKNTWYWGSATGWLEDGKKFGFNIGYGFGDNSAATENMLFYDGVAHKLDQVNFHIPKTGDQYEYMKPWTFSSNDGRFEMNFRPIIDRCDYTSVGILSSDQHQVFGRFSGKAILDDGTVLQIKNLLGFAERVANRW